MEKPQTITWIIAHDGPRMRKLCLEAHTPRIRESFMRRYRGVIETVRQPVGLDPYGEPLPEASRRNLIQGLRRNAGRSAPNPEAEIAVQMICSQIAQIHGLELSVIMGSRSSKTAGILNARVHLAHALTCRMRLSRAAIAGILGLRSPSSVAGLLDKGYIIPQARMELPP